MIRNRKLQTRRQNHLNSTRSNIFGVTGDMPVEGERFREGIFDTHSALTVFRTLFLGRKLHKGRDKAIRGSVLTPLERIQDTLLNCLSSIQKYDATYVSAKPEESCESTRKSRDITLQFRMRNPRFPLRC